MSSGGYKDSIPDVKYSHYLFFPFTLFRNGFRIVTSDSLLFRRQGDDSDQGRGGDAEVGFTESGRVHKWARPRSTLLWSIVSLLLWLSFRVKKVMSSQQTLHQRESRRFEPPTKVDMRKYRRGKTWLPVGRVWAAAGGMAAPSLHPPPPFVKKL